MKSFILRIFYIAALIMLLTPAFAQSGVADLVRLTPDELKWTLNANGTSTAILVGNEMKPGMYAYRIKFPTNFKKEPHFHPDDRFITVISGTLLMGYGLQFDEAKMRELSVGSVWSEPAKQPHFVWAKNGEVIIQVVGYGPSGNTYVQSQH